MWTRCAALISVLIGEAACSATDCTDLHVDPASCSACGMDEPLPPVDGAAAPDWMFLGVGNPYWVYRTEITLTSGGNVQMDTLSVDDGNDEDEGEITPTLASAIFAASLPALVDMLDRPEIPREDDEPAYEFELRADGERMGPTFHAESEVLAAPPLCCVAEAFQEISRCVGGHDL